jgi:hypothetical protein
MVLATEADYQTRLAVFYKHEATAVQYVEDTWLTPWKEKLVQYWVDANLHFSVHVTSLIEGCHAILKAYLRVSIGDLKGVFNRLILY